MTMVSSFAFGGYMTGYFKGTRQTPSDLTHIIVAGVGMELGIQLQLSAVTKAKRLHELYPERQIFLVVHKETGTDARPVNNAALLEKFGFDTELSSDRTFSDKALIDQLVPFTKIASIDFYSHNSPHYGLQLESKYYRLPPNSRENKRLQGHFTADAYAIFHGCNTGFIVAPAFSKTWEIPTAGTLASSAFEYLSKDGEFYFGGQGGGGKASVNDVSFFQEISCANGACTRMKPGNSPYSGIWGEFKGGGLNFFKFFCVKNDDNRCFKSMARSLVEGVSIKAVGARPSLQDYKDLLYDFLCTSAGAGKHRAKCQNNLETYRLTGRGGPNGFVGRQIQCSFKECYAKVDCLTFNGEYLHHTCDVVNHWDGPVDTLEREYDAYLKGFELL
jgi:hypothetical protein